jgi:retinal rod rhodopsin-sensitive cGMP 3',5'-cyclic phosphodiesterase subunit delta
MWCASSLSSSSSCIITTNHNNKTAHILVYTAQHKRSVSMNITDGESGTVLWESKQDQFEEQALKLKKKQKQRAQRLAAAAQQSANKATTTEQSTAAAAEAKTADDSDDELAIHLPAAVLQCASVARELKFSSREPIQNLSLVQEVLLNGVQIEEWQFTFGFCIPNTTNSWQCIIEAAGEGQMLPVAVLNGNIVIRSRFLDGKNLRSETTVRVFDDEKTNA